MRAEWTSVLEAADGVQVAFSLAVYVSQLAIEACVTVLSYQVPNETMSPTALLRPQRVNTKPDFIDRVERVAEASDGNFLGWAGDGTFTSDFQVHQLRFLKGEIPTGSHPCRSSATR
ncbi:unnamed protein product [Aphanomyces euteiches]